MGVTVGNSVIGLYNLVYLCYHRYMASNEHSTAQLMDDLVMRTQEVADLYVRCIDTNPGATPDVPRDAEQLDELFKALAGFVLAEGRAIDAISLYFSGEYEPVGAELEDF